MNFEALFVQDGERVVPTDASLGPWAPGLLHGGAVAALAVLALEDVGDPGYESVRFSADFIRALVQAPMTVNTRLVRSGRRLQLLEGEVVVEGKALARCSLLRLRPAEVELPDEARTEPVPPPDSPDGWHEPAWEAMRPGPFFGKTGIDMRLADATRFSSGTAWFRLRLPVLPGREASPMARAAAAADFGNGISGLVAPAQHLRLTFVNADLTVHLARLPAGEWVRMQSRSTWLPGGTGLTRSELADPGGAIGVAHQTLVLSAS